MKTRRIVLTKSEFKKIAKSIDCSSPDEIRRSILARLPAAYQIDKESVDSDGTTKITVERQWQEGEKNLSADQLTGQIFIRANSDGTLAEGYPQFSNTLFKMLFLAGNKKDLFINTTSLANLIVHQELLLQRLETSDEELEFNGINLAADRVLGLIEPAIKKYNNAKNEQSKQECSEMIDVLNRQLELVSDWVDPDETRNKDQLVAGIRQKYAEELNDEQKKEAKDKIIEQRNDELSILELSFFSHQVNAFQEVLNSHAKISLYRRTAEDVLKVCLKIAKDVCTKKTLEGVLLTIDELVAVVDLTKDLFEKTTAFIDNASNSNREALKTSLEICDEHRKKQLKNPNMRILGAVLFIFTGAVQRLFQVKSGKASYQTGLTLFKEARAIKQLDRLSASARKKLRAKS